MMTQSEALKILKMGKNVFLTGAAGSGKTYILSEYIQFLRDRGVEVAVTASTGIAATHLKGVTIHSWSGIGIKDTLTDYDLDSLEQKQYLWKRYEKTKVLVIDEISMLSASTLDCIDRVAKLFKRNELPFGGMQVIFSGDFFQLPPIEKKKTTEDMQTIFLDDDVVSGTPFAFKSRSWKDCDLNICYLQEQFRQVDDELFDILCEIREGNFSDNSTELLNKRIIKEDNDDITKLHTHNVNVDSFNQSKLDAIPEKENTYRMTTKGNPNLIEALKRGSLLPEELVLKKGALVMFVKNNPVAGYVNGTVGEIIDFDDIYPLVKTKDGKEIVASTQSWAIEEGGKPLAEITQVPLKLAWAVTVHKSQGMTLDSAVIDLSKSFVEGQGYVALSRVKTFEGLFLKGFNKKALEVHGEVRKIDKELRKSSDKLFERVAKIKEDTFKKVHDEFLSLIGAKKFKVLDSEGEKLTTFEITNELIEKGRSLDQMIDERDLKLGTILTHIEKLLEQKVIKKVNIMYLKPKTREFDEMVEEVREESRKLKEFKLTPVHKALGGRYSFEDIRFAKLFI